MQNNFHTGNNFQSDWQSRQQTFFFAIVLRWSFILSVLFCFLDIFNVLIV